MSRDPHGPKCVCRECLLPQDPRQHYSTGGKPKIGHAAEWQARGHARQILRTGADKMRSGNTTLNAYRCGICQLWHVGQA